jgi:hypothetical protein
MRNTLAHVLNEREISSILEGVNTTGIFMSVCMCERRRGEGRGSER